MRGGWCVASALFQQGVVRAAPPRVSFVPPLTAARVAAFVPAPFLFPASLVRISLTRCPSDQPSVACSATLPRDGNSVARPGEQRGGA
jgi:hypothetical protein